MRSIFALPTFGGSHVSKCIRIQIVADHTANIADLMGSYQFLQEYKNTEKLYVFAAKCISSFLGTAICQEALSFFAIFLATV